METNEPKLEATKQEMDQVMKKVMIAIDSRECSDYAIEWALSNLKPIFNAGAGIILFYVIDTDYSDIVSSSNTPSPFGHLNHVQDNQQKVAIALLEEAKDLCANHGINAKTVYEYGNPKEGICEAVECYDVQLLICGSYEGTLIGSVSNYCVNNAKCPVMVVRY